MVMLRLADNRINTNVIIVCILSNNSGKFKTMQDSYKDIRKM